MNVLPDVSESLIVPLCARAYKGEELAIKGLTFLKEMGIEERWHKTSGDNGAFRRGEKIDGLVKKFIEEHPKARILNIGCGFCTRFYRLDNGTITWTELDLPHVIALREQVYRPQRRHLLMAQDLTETLGILMPYELIIAEGVLMYLEKDVVKKAIKGRVIADIPQKCARRRKPNDVSRRWLYNPEDWPEWQILNTVGGFSANNDLLIFEFLASP